MVWTDEMIGTLKRMWLAGSTSSQISKALGTVTRNSVMGKVNRLGLMGSADHNSRSSHVPVGCCRPKPASSAPTPVEVASEEVVAAMPVHADAPIDRTTPVAAESSVPPSQDPEEVGISEVVEAAAPASIEVASPTDHMSGHEILSATDPVPEAVGESATVPSNHTPEVGRSEADPSEGQATVVAVQVPTKRPAVRSLIRESLRAAAVASDRKPKQEDDSSVVRLSTGTIAKCCSLVSSDVRPDWRTAVGLVEELTGQRYDWEKHGHRSSVVAISTILGKGDPRRILLPKMKEPAILVTMRSLALGGLIVGGKTPPRWHDEVTGDTAFFDDMLMVEEVKDAPRIENRVTA